MHKFFFLLVASLFFSSCSQVGSVRYRFFPPTEAQFAREIAYADSLWNDRASLKSARGAVRAFIRLTGMQNHDPELWTRLSHAYYMQANYAETNPDKQYWLFHKGMRAAERALMLHAGYARVMTATGSEILAIREIDSNFLAAAWWYAANLGKRVANETAIIRLENAVLAEAFCAQVMSLDENYYYGGPHRYMGSLHALLPGGNLEVSRSHFEKSLEMAPHYFGTRTLFAEYYAVRAGDKQLFQDLLEYVVEASPGTVPAIEPENIYEQRRASVLLSRINALFPN